MRTEKAAFAAGCFWGIEEEFRTTPGVLKTTAGYAGGHKADPTYSEVCSDTTGHAETVELEFDPDAISYEALLKKFWQLHDPTTPNRQGPDVGSQYRSVIFFYTQEQEAAAKASKERAASDFAAPIVTEIVPMEKFYPAEEYHQQYVLKTGRHVC